MRKRTWILQKKLSKADSRWLVGGTKLDSSLATELSVLIFKRVQALFLSFSLHT